MVVVIGMAVIIGCLIVGLVLIIIISTIRNVQYRLEKKRFEIELNDIYGKQMVKTYKLKDWGSLNILSDVCTTNRLMLKIKSLDEMNKKVVNYWYDGIEIKLVYTLYKENKADVEIYTLEKDSKWHIIEEPLNLIFYSAYREGNNKFSKWEIKEKRNIKIDSVFKLMIPAIFSIGTMGVLFGISEILVNGGFVKILSAMSSISTVSILLAGILLVLTLIYLNIRRNVN